MSLLDDEEIPSKLLCTRYIAFHKTKDLEENF